MKHKNLFTAAVGTKPEDPSVFFLSCLKFQVSTAPKLQTLNPEPEAQN